MAIATLRQQERFEQIRVRVDHFGKTKEGSGGLHFFVGGADGLAGVTAENALADQRAESERDGSAVLNGEV